MAQSSRQESPAFAICVARADAGHTKKKIAPALQDPSNFTNDRAGLGDVLKNLCANHQVKLLVPKRQLLATSQHAHDGVLTQINRNVTPKMVFQQRAVWLDSPSDVQNQQLPRRQLP